MNSSNNQSHVSLSDEQRKLIERNRQIALEKLENKSTTNSTQKPSAGKLKWENNGVNLSKSDSRNFYDKKGHSNFSSNKSSSFFEKKPYNVLNSNKSSNFSDKKSYDSLSSDKSSNFSNKKSYDSLSSDKSFKKPDPKICFKIVSKDRFTIDFPFDTHLVDICKTIPSRRYDMTNKTWNFDINDYQKLYDQIKKIDNPKYQLDEIPKNVVKFLLDELNSVKYNDLDKNSNYADKIDDSRLQKIDPKLSAALLPFQYESFKFAIANEGKMLLADDMGLGKTVQSLAIANYYKDEWPLLVITPASLKRTWESAILNWYSFISPSTVNVVISAKDFNHNSSIFIVGYDHLSKFIGSRMDKIFSVIIADECHYIKNSRTARTKSFMDIAGRANRLILCSGTPALSRPSELYCQIKALLPKFFSNFYEYGQRYCGAKQTRFGWDFSGCSNMEELRILLESKIMLRRLKSDVIEELPDKLRKIILLDSSLLELSHFDSKVLKTTSIDKPKMRKLIMESFSQTALVKSKAVCDYLLHLLECEEKFIVFAHHQSMMDNISAFLIKNSIKFIRIDGNTPSNSRQQLVDTFQTDSSTMVALLSIKASATGITLTSAKCLVFAELFWNPGVLAQAEDRIYRIGQKNVVTIIYLIANSTADDFIWPIIKNKVQNLKSVGIGSTDITNGICDNYDPNKLNITDFFNTDSDDISDIFESFEKCNKNMGSSNYCINLAKEQNNETKQNIDLSDMNDDSLNDILEIEDDINGF